EFQDFNPLEVAFIDELEKKGPILIVGDDDQAIYDDRFASPEHLRKKFRSGQYETFQLPFCSRCPEVIVEATNSVIDFAKKNGALEGRISKPYKCYLADKVVENIKYPKIIVSQCANAITITKYVDKVISKIDKDEILESWEGGKEYPTVLIVGSKQYLTKIEKELKAKYPQMKYTKPSGKNEYNLSDGYEQLLKVKDSNLGWRILAEIFLDGKTFESILKETTKGTPMVELLDDEFLSVHRRIVALIQEGKEKGELTMKVRRSIKSKIGSEYADVISHFFPTEEEEIQIDKTKPSILLTSFKGCKGLSAGHVIIVGANNGSIPIDPHDVKDVEIGQFIVALTRTRKQCHIVSNKWLYSPKDSEGNWITAFEPTGFLNLIPAKFINDLGYLKAEQVKCTSQDII
ncbi:MAG: UvrD-helicase domain-containing protein, partial [Bacteroidota bacterium]